MPKQALGIVKTGDLSMCHLIFFIPFFALPVFWVLPFNSALTMYLIICGLCSIIYFKIFQAMRIEPWNGKEAMLGRTGLVIEDIDPEGKIQYATEIWNAIGDGKKFAKGEKVIIRGFGWGLRVLVQEIPVKGR
jgi:membrane protein implicated in regulation of membrane protease activity